MTRAQFATRLATPLTTTLLLTFAAASEAYGQDAPTASEPENYRWAIYTSCTVAFVAIVAYLIVTHLRAAAVAESLSAVERRLDELEKGAR